TLNSNLPGAWPRAPLFTVRCTFALMYHEQQRLGAPFIWLIWSALLFYGIFGGLRTFLLGLSTPGIPQGGWFYAMLLVFWLMVGGTLLGLRLLIAVNSAGVSITFGPLAQKKYAWKVLRKAQVVRKGRRVLGRSRRDGAEVLNAGGAYFMVLETRAGERLEVSTGQPEALAEALKRKGRRMGK
ncbi:MAG: hypothetical protein RI842_07875, partial [Schleiferiaceae bacterium]|nr:hypothetical protein [Schleiferiaceae bacterium]